MFGMAAFSTPAHLSAPGAAAMPAVLHAVVAAAVHATAPADGLRR